MTSWCGSCGRCLLCGALQCLFTVYARECVFASDGFSSTVLAFSLFRATVTTEGWLVHSEHISACFACGVCAPRCLGFCVTWYVCHLTSSFCLAFFLHFALLKSFAWSLAVKEVLHTQTTKASSLFVIFSFCYCRWLVENLSACTSQYMRTLHPQSEILHECCSSENALIQAQCSGGLSCTSTNRSWAYHFYVVKTVSCRLFTTTVHFACHWLFGCLDSTVLVSLVP